jgi:hypothetical protein
MARRKHHYKRRTGETYDIDVTTFLNLMVVLVPFLLITAVFSRMTIVELDLPSTAGGQTNTESNFRVEVIVREEGIVISNGTGTIATIPNLDDDEYDLDPYDYLIQVMDIVRSIEVPTDIEEEVELVALFTEISVGDAP